MTLRPTTFFSSLSAPAGLLLWLAPLFPVLAACGNGGDDDSDFATGNLGQAKFAYTCIDATDSACAGTTAFTPVPGPGDPSSASDGGTEGGQAQGAGTQESSETTPYGANPPTFPLAIAVGSEFRVTYDGAADNGSPLETPASSSVGAGVFKTVTNTYLEPIGSGPNDFRALTAGYAGVYIENTFDSQLVDYTLLHLVNVDALSLGDANLSPLGTSFTLTGRTATTFTVTPLHDKTAVAGAIDLEWTVDDPSLVKLTTPNPTARMTVSPLGTGKTTLHVSGLGMTASIDVTVSP